MSKKSMNTTLVVILAIVVLISAIAIYVFNSQETSTRESLDTARSEEPVIDDTNSGGEVPDGDQPVSGGDDANQDDLVEDPAP